MENPTELKLYPPSRELARVAEGWTYGSTHTHSEIAEILGIPQQENTYYQAVSDANEILLPKSKMIRNVRGVGYLVVNPDSYEDVSYDRVKKSKEYLLRACEIAQYAPREEMTPEDRARFDRYVVGLGTRAALFMREFESKQVISGPMKIRLSERRPLQLEKKDEPQ
jgi:hypothetical protein